MKKVKYTSEEDFKEYEVEINDELYNVVEKINKHLSKTKKSTNYL